MIIEKDKIIRGLTEEVTNFEIRSRRRNTKEESLNLMLEEYEKKVAEVESEL